MASTAASMINLARTQIGYREGPRDNENKFSKETPSLGWSDQQPWCQTFVSWLAWKTNNKDVIPTTASCLTCTNYFKSRGQFHYQGPKPGDLVMYGANGGTHVDMVTEVSGAKIRVIGGNTGGNLNGAYYNGNGVYEKWIDASSSKIHGFGRPSYSGAGNINGGGTTIQPPVGKPDKPLVADNKFTVKKGMTLLGIAALLGVTLQQLLGANPDVKDPDKITEGQELNIPSPDKPPAKPDPEGSKPPTSKPTGEKPGEDGGSTKPGDGGLTSKPITGTKPTGEKPTTGGNGGGGTVTTRPTTSHGQTTTYVVKQGDTLWGIATKHGITLQKLLDLNTGRFPNPDLIFSGQKVFLTGDAIKVPDTINTVRPSQPTPPVVKPEKPVTPKPAGEKPVTSKPIEETKKPEVEKPPVDQVNVAGLDQSTGGQRNWDRPLTAAEKANARVIYDVALEKFGATDGPRAAVIAIATSYQESRLQNIRHGDRDSLGLFQQRPSMDWGTAAQIMDPRFAATSFFDGRGTNQGLKSFNWKSMTLTQAAQKVQKSGTPNAFAAWERSAAAEVRSFAGSKSGKHAAPYDEAKDKPKGESEKPATNSAGWVRPVAGAVGTPFGKPGAMWSSGYHTGTDFPVPQGTKVAAAGSGKVIKTGWGGAYGMMVEIQHADGIVSRYCHLSAIGVGTGAEVKAGQQIGNVGSTGNSTGPHLHLEFLVGGKQVDPMKFIR
ncbi:peptidoglycan DD-metalloendopeptidase family protein [Streptomyces sp. NPDC002120]|uniref:peptidoglycan DD-metalloendopeptidase family protein n=1 Tax=Streptomyces sp. NPDC002120 TaxID=3364631 RepID=UPI0036B8276F